MLHRRALLAPPTLREVAQITLPAVAEIAGRDDPRGHLYVQAYTRRWLRELDSVGHLNPAASAALVCLSARLLEVALDLQLADAFQSMPEVTHA